MGVKSDFKNLQSLEICGGGLTDAGVKNIKDLTCLTVLNLSQNCNLTDKSLELISGICVYFSLFEESIIAYSKTQFAGSKNIIPYSCLLKACRIFSIFCFSVKLFLIYVR